MCLINNLSFFFSPIFGNELDCLKLDIAGDVGSVYFGPNHPMKPHRLCMTHHLVLSYELHKKMEIYVSHINRVFRFLYTLWVFVTKLFTICVAHCINNDIPFFFPLMYDAAPTQSLSC